MPSAATPASGGAILALNAGSSSLKFGVYSAGDRHSMLLKGAIEKLDDAPHLTASGADGQTLADRHWGGAPPDHDELLGDVIDWIEDHLGREPLGAAGHRIVHGGSRFAGAVRLTPQTIEAIAALTPLAPLHQPLGLAPVHALNQVQPNQAQIACFDTAFHRDLAPPVSRYALPLRYEEKGIRRYGFHGLSYEYIASRLGELSPELPQRRTVVAHLGSGASLCAMRDGRSHDTTMGFSALDGLVMSTRSGAIDPGILLYLLQEEGMSPKALEELLYHKAGLLGVSGISGDVRELLASPEPRAREALELFAFHVARETAAMANTLGGLELFVFTGGIGEHSAPVRQMIAERLAWLGVKLDGAANTAGRDRLDAPGSGVEIRVIATDEELTIARQVAALRAA